MTTFLLHLAAFADVLPHAHDPPRGMSNGPPHERPRRPHDNKNKAATGC